MELSELQAKVEGMAKRSLRDRRVPMNQVGSAVGSPGQGMQKRLHEMFDAVLPGYDFGRLFVMDVGDITRFGGDTGYDIKTSLPVASDIWYLTIGASVLPFRGEGYQDAANKILGFLADYLAYLDNIKPLKSLHDYRDLHVWNSWQEGRNVFSADNAPYVIREMRFETWMLNRNTEFPPIENGGPKASAEAGTTKKSVTSLGQLYAGLLSFPVGPLGVMEVISIFSESMKDMLEKHIPFSWDGAIQIESPSGWKCVTDQPLDGFMSPMTDIKGQCPGVHLVNKGYLMENPDTEYPTVTFSGFDPILPLQSFRFYLRRSSKWPLPGEFIGLLAKPWPAHVWWFQKTSPFLYSGNWFETNHYTSGIVKEVMPPIEGVTGTVYKCVVRGVEVCISASDYYEYKVGNRVAVIRIGDLDRFTDAERGNFKWKEMADLVAGEKLEKETPSNLPYIINASMMIVPMSFYNP